MVYGIVKQNNGFIIVESEPGQGTSFKIYLPRETAKPERVVRKDPAGPAARGQETILLVEDEQLNLALTACILKGLGYTVLAAATPGEAIRLAEAHPGEIPLLCTDVVLPEMSGLGLFKTLKSSSECWTRGCISSRSRSSLVIWPPSYGRPLKVSREITIRPTSQSG
jgi:CheY-like chemotaxis protein